jgi:ligand-binding sensor domain-containing protein
MPLSRHLAALLLALVCSACMRPLPAPPQEPAQATAQPPSPYAGDSFKSPQLDDYIVELYEDRKGHLWFGTVTQGAARYDGVSLTYYNTDSGLVDATVTCVMEDAAGNYWFGTHGGASRWDGKTWTTFSAAEGLPGGGCTLHIDRKGRFWAGSDQGAFQFDGQRFQEFPLPRPDVGTVSHKVRPGKVWGILEDSQGHIWFARDSYGACRYDGKTFRHFTTADGLPSNNVARVVEDAQGHIWFGCLTSDFPKPLPTGGVSRYDGKSMIRFPDVPGLDAIDTYTIYPDRAGQVWISALDRGVYRYADGRFTLITQSDRADLIRRYGLQSMLHDSRGRLWLGFSGGLFRLDGERLQNVTQAGPWK